MPEDINDKAIQKVKDFLTKEQEVTKNLLKYIESLKAKTKTFS